MDNPNVPANNPPPGSNLAPNAAAAVSYLLGFLTGVYFLLTSKDKFVRFHAMQSTIASLALIILIYLIGYLPGLFILAMMLNLLYLMLFIFLIIKAYNNEMYKLPYIGDFAEKNS